MSIILKLFVFPIPSIIICLGINTILGGHITPGGGFQGGAMIAGGLIFCIITYGLSESPFKITHDFMASMESAGSSCLCIPGSCRFTHIRLLLVQSGSRSFMV